MKGRRDEQRKRRGRGDEEESKRDPALGLTVHLRGPQPQQSKGRSRTEGQMDGGMMDEDGEKEVMKALMRDYGGWEGQWVIFF